MFECHITIMYIEPETIKHDVMSASVKQRGFRVAKLYKNNDKLSVLDTFMTAHDSDYNSLKQKMIDTIYILRDLGHTVTRFKIEQILLDSKNGDTI